MKSEIDTTFLLFLYQNLLTYTLYLKRNYCLYICSIYKINEKMLLSTSSCYVDGNRIVLEASQDSTNASNVYHSRLATTVVSKTLTCNHGNNDKGHRHTTQRSTKYRRVSSN
mgnify:CR=1 FL=1